jgi:hypothetical protein
VVPDRFLVVELLARRRIPARDAGGLDVRSLPAAGGLHLTIIFGAIAVLLTGAPAAAVAILVAVKTAIDLGLHIAEHRGMASPRVAVTS